MKQRTRFLITTLFVVAAFAVAPNLYAQPGVAPIIPVEGYVVLDTNDTLVGQLRWTLKYVENNPVEIKFTSANGDARTFTAEEIKGFGNVVPDASVDDLPYVEMQYQDYVSVPSFKKGVPVFMHRLLPGRLTVLQNRSAIASDNTQVVESRHFDGIEFSWSSDEGLFIGPTYKVDYRVIKGRTRYSSYFVSKENGPLMKIDKKNYEENFDTLFGDCPAIGEELTLNPDLKEFRNFMILVEVYNRLCQ